MRSRLLDENDGLRTWVLVMDKDDEAFEQISAFAGEEGLTAASLTAVGATKAVTLGYFDPEVMEYRLTDFEEQMEVLSLVGDIAMKGDTPALHAHLVLGRRDSSTLGGHLKRLVAWPTLEVVIEQTPAELRKVVDPETGLALIAPQA